MKLLQVFFYLLGFLISWLTLIFGWGLEPQSWLWIFGGSLGSIFAMGIGQALSEAFK